MTKEESEAMVATTNKYLEWSERAQILKQAIQEIEAAIFGELPSEEKIGMLDNTIASPDMRGRCQEVIKRHVLVKRALRACQEKIERHFP